MNALLDLELAFAYAAERESDAFAGIGRAAPIRTAGTISAHVWSTAPAIHRGARNYRRVLALGQIDFQHLEQSLVKGG